MSETLKEHCCIFSQILPDYFASLKKFSKFFVLTFSQIATRLQEGENTDMRGEQHLGEPKSNFVLVIPTRPRVFSGFCNKINVMECVLADVRQFDVENILCSLVLRPTTGPR